MNPDNNSQPQAPQTPEEVSPSDAKPLPTAAPPERGHNRHLVLWIAVATVLIIGVAAAGMYMGWFSPAPAPTTNTQAPGTTEKPAAESFVGLSEADAISKADAANIEYRIIARDGEEYVITMDLRPDRINFTVDEGKVSKADYY